MSSAPRAGSTPTATTCTATVFRISGDELRFGRDEGPFLFACPQRQAAQVLRAWFHPTLHGVVFDILIRRGPQPIGCRQTAGPSAIHPVQRPLPAVRSGSAAPRCAPAAADGNRRRMAMAPAAS